jgi:ADP-ribosylglycohydrolase
MGMLEAMIGVLIGDATGVGVEFKSRETMTDHIDFTSYVNALDPDFSKNLHSGEYSDDGEHSIAVLRAISDSSPFTTELLFDYFKNEYFSDKARKGYPRHGHGSIEKIFLGKKTLEEVRSLQSKRDDPGNAPPMRAVPLGFLPDDLIDSYAVVNADVTHPHPKGRAASIAVARATQYMVVQKGNPLELISYCKQFISDFDTLSTLSAVDKLPAPELLRDTDYEVLCGHQPMPFTPVPEWVVYGLPCASMRTAASALYLVKHSSDAFTGLKRAINMGGDVDSLAAITTGILAGRYGLTSLPDFMIEEVEGKDNLPSLVDNFQSSLK